MKSWIVKVNSTAQNRGTDQLFPVCEQYFVCPVYEIDKQMEYGNDLTIVLI